MIQKEITIAVKETGLDAVNKKVNKLEQSVESLEAEQKSLARSMGESSNAVLENGGAMGLLNDATGGLAMTVKDAVEASWLFTKSQKAQAIQQSIATAVVGTSTGAMKAFRIALAATGVGAIVIALVMLIANFDKVKKAVLNLVPGLASVGEWFGKIIDGVTDFIGVTSKAERQLEAFDKASQKRSDELDKKLAERGSLYSESAKKKMAIDAKLEEDLRKHIYNEVELRKEAQRQKDAIDRENAKKEAEKLADEQKRQREAKEKARQDAIEAAKKESERILNERKDYLDKQNKASEELESLKEEKRKKDYEKEKEDSEKKKEIMYSELSASQRIAETKKKQTEQEITDAQMLRDAKVDIANQTLMLISEIAGRGSKIAKATAIAQATMSGIEGVQNTFTTASKSPITTLFPAYPFIQAGLAGAFSALQIARLVKGDRPSGGSGGGGGVRGSAPQAPSFNLVQGTGQNQIAESISKQAPVKAFVVSKDVTNGQELDRNLLNNASL